MPEMSWLKKGFDCLTAGAADVGGAMSDADAPQPPAPAPPVKRRRLRRAAGAPPPAAAALPAVTPSPATGVFADDSSDGEPRPGPSHSDMAAEWDPVAARDFQGQRPGWCRACEAPRHLRRCSGGNSPADTLQGENISRGMRLIICL